MNIKDWLIVMFCTTGGPISIYVGDQIIRADTIRIGLHPAQYMWIVMRYDGHILGYKLNRLGRWLLV